MSLSRRQNRLAFSCMGAVLLVRTRYLWTMGHSLHDVDVIPADRDSRYPLVA
jgi:hypothetical protein